MKKYEMTQQQLDRILEACRPVAMIAIHCGPIRSPQENANAAWATLGEELGFDSMTVRPAPEGDRFFYAEPRKP